jgi:fatty acyl-CoA reductase
MVDCPVVTHRLNEALAGRRILLTGATGFVGEALLERLLNDLPDTSVVLLVRGRPGASADQRITALLASPAYGRLRERLGPEGIDALVGTRITVLEGDLTHIPPLPGDLDIVIHCAGEVSFDPAIDEGFATNVHGTLNLLAAIEASGSTPHYVHVSTAYVAGRQQGHVREGRLDHDIDWQAEADVAGGMRERMEAESRLPDRLGSFLAEAEREHGHSGHTAVGADAERRRREWVTKAMIDAGRQRALSLGWTDCYTFTKAMAERAVEQTAAHLPVTILRPSIIESALEQPYPGWIEGFKMAEPIILAFGRGDLPDFPGLPDGTIDIIPVDLVVNASIAASAQTPPPGEPSYFTICSGARNPLTFHRLYQLVRGYFTEHPLVQPDRGAVRVPEWQWPGSARVGQLIDLGEKAHKVVDRVVTSLPRSDRSRGWARSLDRQKRRLDFLRRYFDLYRPYADAELIFHDSHTLALHEALHPDDLATFGFDAAVIDWPHYLIGIHVPAVVEPMRAFTTSRPPRPDPVRTVVAAEHAVAVFDMDGTLLPSNVVESYLWLRLPELPGAQRAREVVDVAGA